MEVIVYNFKLLRSRYLRENEILKLHFFLYAGTDIDTLFVGFGFLSFFFLRSIDLLC